MRHAILPLERRPHPPYKLARVSSGGYTGTHTSTCRWPLRYFLYQNTQELRTVFLGINSLPDTGGTPVEVTIVKVYKNRVPEGELEEVAEEAGQATGHRSW